MNIKDQIKIALAQFDVKIFDKQHNIDKIIEMTKQAKYRHNADLIVFPECSLAGYCFSSIDEIASVAEELSGPSVSRIAKLSKDEQICIVFGIVEKKDGEYYNSAVYCQPDGKIHSYNKVHLPYLGGDRFVKHGNKIEVVDTCFGKVGFLICYDLRVPEISRELALNGARLLIQPTNLPVGAESGPNFLTRARASENKVFLVSCNRIGEERGYTFFGRSQIVDISGKIVQESGDGEEIICHTFDLRQAECKDAVIIPGEYEIYLYKHRYPELYPTITKQL